MNADEKKEYFKSRVKERLEKAKTIIGRLVEKKVIVIRIENKPFTLVWGFDPKKSSLVWKSDASFIRAYAYNADGTKVYVVSNWGLSHEATELVTMPKLLHNSGIKVEGIDPFYKFIKDIEDSHDDGMSWKRDHDL